jgi:DNA adenine methylase
MAINKLVTPVVKWVGGKRQIINEIVKYVPKYSTYYEPL